MPATTRTKASGARRATRLPTQQQSGIQGFAKAVKPGVQDSTGKGALALKKRKLEAVEETESDPSSLRESQPTKLRKAEPPSRSAKKLLQSPGTERPRRPARSAASPEKAGSRSTHSNPDTSLTPIESPAYRDLIRLHTSFLQALSLHYTHNGHTAPANVKDIFPTLDRIWKKRKVTTEDIQRIVYIQGVTRNAQAVTSSPKFRICNYGTRHCIERVETSPQPSKTGFNLPFNETELHARFAQNLETLWRQKLSDSGNQDIDVTKDIPLAPIHKSDAGVPSQNTARRQQLLDIGAGTIKLKKSDASVKTKDIAAGARKPNALFSRQSSLLERIQAKQADQANQPAPPSEETLLRRSSADRIPEVVNILLMLSPTAPGDPPRRPFRLHTITQNIQDSMRTPISAREVETCFDILAQQGVAGDWVTVVTVNHLKSVVLRGGRHISPCKIAKRVKDLEL